MRALLSWQRVIFILTFGSFLLFSSCGETGELSDGFESESLQDGVVPNSGEGVKLYSLPAPLQVATAIRLFELEYSEGLLAPTTQHSADYSNSVMQAINLGIYGIDMGYATIYKQHSVAIKYMGKIQKLADDLNIADGLSVETAKRFESNIDQQDSLYRIILSSFNEAHQYLMENNRQDVGLLITTGVFIEGLYLSTQFSEVEQYVDLQTMVGQQQMFLDNLIVLLGEYAEDPDIANQIKELKIVKLAFEGVPEYKGEKQKIKLSPQQLQRIALAAKELRDKITS